MKRNNYCGCNLVKANMQALWGNVFFNQHFNGKKYKKTWRNESDFNNNKYIRYNHFFLCTIIPCYAICTVSLMAFSGQTPTSWGPRPRYSPSTPSWRMTFLKQSQLFLYINSPTMGPDLWFCILVFTKSIG